MVLNLKRILWLKSAKEIEELLIDEFAFADHFYSLEQVKPMKRTQVDFLKQNFEIAS